MAVQALKPGADQDETKALRAPPDPFPVIPFPVRKDDTPLSEQELISVYAVLAHIAHSQDMRQDLLQSMVEAEFSVTHIAKIPRRRLHEVLEFLIDLRMDNVRSCK